MAKLTLHGIVKRYGEVDVVRDVSIEVRDGELLVLLGPSGSGKTTILRIVAGLERTDDGIVAIGERDVTRLPPAARDVAMVFQSHALFPHLTVRGNLGFGLAARKHPADDIVERVERVAETLGITSLLERKPAQLSGGERQRVALGRAMVREPAVFLMDEPLSSLDAQLRAQMRAEIARLQAALGTTTLYVTHDQTEALGLGHRIVVLNAGRIEQIGSPDEIYGSPASLFVAGFVGSPPMNLFEAARDGDVLRWSGGAMPAKPDAPMEVIVGVRPEHVHVAGSRWSMATRRGQEFRARVELVESAGDQAHLHLDAGGVRLVARAEPSIAIARGDEVDAWFDPTRLHVFDPRSGVVIP